MENVMSRAWEIKRKAAEKYNCNVREIIFDICLKMAHKGEAIMNEMIEKMKGSEKQIDWAEKIKARLLEEITKEKAEGYIENEGLENDEFSITLLDRFIEKIRTSNDAGWFIEKARHVSFYTFEVDEDDEG